LALLAARCMAESSSRGDAPTLDLINVAFGPEQSAVVPQSPGVAAALQSHGRAPCQCRANLNPKMASSAATSAEADAFRWFDVPDRLAAVNSLCELKYV
jgi:hypothetical protein